MLNLDIDLLRAFVAVADTGGFTSASRLLHRTQSAVSMQVKRIEDMLNKRVFDRSGRSVKLTTDGEILISHARRMLKINEQAIEDLVTPEIEGVVRLGIPDGYGTYYLPRIFSSFSRAYPQVQLQVRCGLTGQMIDSLEAGDLDLALLVKSPSTPGGVELWAESIDWVSATESPLFEADPVPLVMFDQTCTIRANALQTLDEIGKRWHIVFFSHSLAAIQAAVLAGLGVAILGSSTVLPGMRTLGRSQGFPVLSPSIIELYRSPAQSSPNIDLLAQHITNKLRGWMNVPTPTMSRVGSLSSQLSRVI